MRGAPQSGFSRLIFRINWRISEGTAAFRELVDSGRMRQLQNRVDRIAGYVGTTISAVDYLQAQRVRKLARLAVDELLSRYDALLGPTITSPAARIDQTINRTALAAVPLVAAGNIAGLPAITVPNGFGENRLPSGLQFLGAAWSEAKLLGLADAYQQATDFHTQRPIISDL
jgi:aspartyl-tRNA(Asn)/glutamyl-tRNA(Gln) amidotransferase subunit A